MQVKFKDTSLDLSNGPLLMGIIELDPRVPFDPVSVQKQAKDYLDCGAIGLQLGICSCTVSDVPANTPSASLSNNDPDALAQVVACSSQDSYTCTLDDVVAAYQNMSTESRAQMLVAACKAVLEIQPDVILGIYTSEPLVMEQTVATGAHFIIDPMALREPGALETVSRLKVNVCLCFDQAYKFDEDDKVDVCGQISEFFYERIDACINAKIDRKKIMLDPSIGRDVGVDYRIKLQGRLKSFNSFALPLSCEIPRVFPTSDEFLRRNMSVTVAVALFMTQQGFNIIRTKHVYDIGLALDTWLALNFSARPFKIRSLIGRKIKSFKDKKAAKNQAKAAAQG